MCCAAEDRCFRALLSSSHMKPSTIESVLQQKQHGWQWLPRFVSLCYKEGLVTCRPAGAGYCAQLDLHALVLQYLNAPPVNKTPPQQPTPVPVPPQPEAAASQQRNLLPALTTDQPTAGHEPAPFMSQPSETETDVPQLGPSPGDQLLHAGHLSNPNGWLVRRPGPHQMNEPVSSDPAIQGVLAVLVSLPGHQRLRHIRQLVRSAVPFGNEDCGKLAASIMIYLGNHWQGVLGPCTADQAACYDNAWQYARIPDHVLQRLMSAPDWLPTLMGAFSGGLVTCSPSLSQPGTYVAQLDLHALVARSLQQPAVHYRS